MNYIGIDNGVTGSIGIIADDVHYKKTPIVKCLNYTKSKQFITRIDTPKLYEILSEFSLNCFCFIERPMINPGRFKATVSAIRALEATIVILERLAIPYQFIDSKEWQKALLPRGLEKEELKIASLDVGKRLFPNLDFAGFKDADGLLIAEYCKRLKGNFS